MDASFVKVDVRCSARARDILIAEFSDSGYNIFQETDIGFTTAIESKLFKASALDAIIIQYEPIGNPSYQISTVSKQNWNKSWEQNYDPILIDDKCFVRASFHKPNKDVPFEIIITPKMSFGTGHHETTYLMLKAQMQIDHHDKRVLDVGCGTGILTIMAGKLGATSITSCDIDAWAVASTQENIEINNISAIVCQCTVQKVKNTDLFDIVLANINKNVLLGSLSFYSAQLISNGYLLLSGFYETDLVDIKETAARSQLKLRYSATKNRWAMAVFVKE